MSTTAHADEIFAGDLASLDAPGLNALDLLDHRDVPWARVRRSAYLIHQQLRYEYPGPIEALEHHLVVIPPEQVGDQRRLFHQLDVRGATAARAEREDQFGNVVIAVTAPVVHRAIDFEAWVVVVRHADDGLRNVPTRWLTDPLLREPSPLTQPDDALRQAARDAAGGATGPDLVARLGAWVYATMRYEPGATHVGTAAAEALAIGRGVCQDYAHVMVALCRLCGVPARYVSGHLLGEGGTHAWVEVILPDPRAPGSAVALGFDPTHNRPTDVSYLLIAVGREYADVAPTSGRYRAGYGGQLSARKRVGLAAVEYGVA